MSSFAERRQPAARASQRRGGSRCGHFTPTHHLARLRFEGSAPDSYTRRTCEVETVVAWPHEDWRDDWRADGSTGVVEAMMADLQRHPELRASIQKVLTNL